jgi:N6-L-threonylcarbamoyladenine synthase
METKLILGIETSCDDTSLCLILGSPGIAKANQETHTKEILSHQTFSQNLAKWGGVVPEIAARNHIQKLTPLVQATLEEAGKKFEDIDAIAVTALPGLLGPLLTGISYAKTISLLKKLPIIPINHLFAHLEAVHIDQQVSYPYLGLLVSGGHSLFVKVSSPLEMEVISSTIDDAAGEAFDKGGKILGLPYPAGKIIDDLAKEGNDQFHKFPIGLKGSKDGRMSFSGLKTSLRQFVEQRPEVKEPNSQILKDVCASYQKAIVESLTTKAKEVFHLLDAETKELPFVVGGGVACNSLLRSEMKKRFDCHFVTPKFCTDNGAMVANLGLLNYEEKVNYPECLNIDAQSRYISKTSFAKTDKSK